MVVRCAKAEGQTKNTASALPRIADMTWALDVSKHHVQATLAPYQILRKLHLAPTSCYAQTMALNKALVLYARMLTLECLLQPCCHSSLCCLCLLSGDCSVMNGASQDAQYR